MDVREYSEGVRDVVKMVGNSRVACRPDTPELSEDAVMEALWEHELITQFPYNGYYRLTDKGRALLCQMGRDAKINRYPMSIGPTETKGA